MPKQLLNLGSISNRPAQGIGGFRQVVFEEDEAIKRLPAVEAAIRTITAPAKQERVLEDDFAQMSVGRLERWTVRPEGRYARMRRIFKILHSASVPVEKDGKSIRFSLHAQALVDCAESFRLDLGSNVSSYERQYAEFLHSQLNEFLNKLNAVYRSPEFIRRARAQDDATKGRRDSLSVWFKAVLKAAPEVLCLHMQLGFQPRSGVDVSSALHHREAFLKARRGWLSSQHMLGYVCKLHYSKTKGYFHDLIILYDARYVVDLMSLSREMGERWCQIAGQSGVPYIEGVSMHSDAPKLNGIFTLKDRSDRKKLDQIIEYLSAYDTYVHFTVPKNMRTLVKSQAPKRARK